MDYHDNRITFNVIYLTQNAITNKVKTEVESVDYNPILQNDMDNYLKSVGFLQINVIKSFGKVKFIAYK